ncbi:MAG: hypothetical protein PHI76_00940 [Clostridia bacterium]|nr:hypothetical protein [Clostridia bacterium]
MDFQEYFFGIKSPVTYKDDKVFYNGRIVTDGKEGLMEYKVFYSEGKYYNKSDGKEATLSDLIEAEQFNLLSQQTDFVSLEKFVANFKKDSKTKQFKIIKRNINAIKDLLEISKHNNIERKYIEIRRKVYLDLIKLEQEKSNLNPRIIYNSEKDKDYKIIYLYEGISKEAYLKEKQNRYSPMMIESKKAQAQELCR